jgi:YegS/Rv2252/BmrU family lipid kinase
VTNSFLAIVNPAAGHGRCGKLFGPTLERLRAAGLDIDVAETQYAGHGVALTREAYRRGYRRFIAVGGDGTSYEIVNGLFPEASDDEPPTLGFLPLGTGNSFLRDFTDRGLDYATESLMAGRSRPCDVVKLTHRDGVVYYINILSLGFVADVCALTNRYFKWMSFMGYGLAVMLCMAQFKRVVYPIRIDGAAEMDRTRTALLIFNNSKYTAGTMMLAPDADVSDGLVEIVCWAVGRLGFILNFANMYDGSHINHPALWHRGARRIEFDLDRPVNIMIDGEVLRVHCQSLEVLPSVLKVMV